MSDLTGTIYIYVYVHICVFLEKKYRIYVKSYLVNGMHLVLLYPHKDGMHMSLEI